MQDQKGRNCSLETFNMLSPFIMYSGQSLVVILMCFDAGTNCVEDSVDVSTCNQALHA